MIGKYCTKGDLNCDGLKPRWDIFVFVAKAVLRFDSNEGDDCNGAKPCHEYEAIISAPVPDQEAGVEAAKHNEAGYDSRNDCSRQDIWNI